MHMWYMFSIQKLGVQSSMKSSGDLSFVGLRNFEILSQAYPTTTETQKVQMNKWTVVDI